MFFVILQRYRKKPAKEDVERAGRYMAELMQGGMKAHAALYTLGRYDAVFIIETTDPKMDEKFIVEKLIEISDVVQTETMVAVPQAGVRLFSD